MNNNNNNDVICVKNALWKQIEENKENIQDVRALLASLTDMVTELHRDLQKRRAYAEREGWNWDEELEWGPSAVEEEVVPKKPTSDDDSYDLNGYDSEDSEMLELTQKYESMGAGSLMDFLDDDPEVIDVDAWDREENKAVEPPKKKQRLDQSQWIKKK